MTLTLDSYQQSCVDLCFYGEDRRVVYPTLGLAGETGEYCEKVVSVLVDSLLLTANVGTYTERIKKILRDGPADFTAIESEKMLAIKKELGDALFYIAACAADFNWDLSDVAQTNLDKLHDRQQRDKLGGEGDDR